MTDKNFNFFFSIMICSYNSEKYISETLDSIIAQSFKKWEIIIVDDGSTDNSTRIIENYTNKDEKSKLIKQKNQGLASARNTAIRNSNSDWIVIIDHDDKFNIDRLQNQYEDIIKNPDCKLLFGDSMLFDAFNFKKNALSVPPAC